MNVRRTLHLARMWLALLTAVVLAPACNSSPSLPAGPSAAPPSISDSPPNGPRRSERATNSFEFRVAGAEIGIDWTYRNGSEANHCTILESLGAGVGLLDYDGDHKLDICFTGGGTLAGDVTPQPLKSALFRNLGEQRFVAVSDAAGFAPASHYTHGVSAADYDNDGWTDVLLTGYGGVQLWRNMGDGTFLDATASSGLDADHSWSSSAAWGDINGDGQLDLYLAHYTDWSPRKHPFCPAPEPGQREICGPREFNPLPDSLFSSTGDGTFRDASTEARLRPDGKGLGVVAGDVDLDGDLDIYVANDTTENFLYLNDGHGRLEEVGVLAGVATDDRGVPDGSMGVDMMDFNNDGRPDLWAANYEREAFALYRNEGHGQFLHVSQATGITALGGLFVGFGTAFVDLDLDGDEDVLVANGHVIKYPRTAPRRQPPLLLENRAGRFVRAAFPSDHYFSQAWESRGLACGDLDQDGVPDVVIAHVNEPSRVLFNRQTTDRNWVAVRLIGVRSNRTAIGARLVLHTSAGDQLRLVKGGGSYLSQSDYNLVWGVPAGATIDKLTVYWPSGQVQEIVPTLKQETTVVEP